MRVSWASKAIKGVVRQLSRVGSGVFRSLVFAAFGMAAIANAQVTTYHYNASRTGATTSETILNTSNVNVTNFGKLFSLAVDGEVYAQPCRA
jgi:hypothetical protein